MRDKRWGGSYVWYVSCIVVMNKDPGGSLLHFLIYAGRLCVVLTFRGGPLGDATGSVEIQAACVAEGVGGERYVLRGVEGVSTGAFRYSTS